MTIKAAGTFEVTLSPHGPGEKSDGVGRMSIKKHFAGDLNGTSSGEMLTAITDVEGSSGYVAVERVTGSLHGLNGSFVLQHSGTLTRGAPQQSITIVPDSGSGELTGVGGKMVITMAEGVHLYDLEYTMP